MPLENKRACVSSRGRQESRGPESTRTRHQIHALLWTAMGIAGWEAACHSVISALVVSYMSYILFEKWLFTMLCGVKCQLGTYSLSLKLIAFHSEEILWLCGFSSDFGQDF